MYRGQGFLRLLLACGSKGRVGYGSGSGSGWGNGSCDGGVG